MTKWKVGDKAEVVKINKGMNERTEIGDIATVSSIDEDGYPLFDIDTETDFVWGFPDDYYRPIITRKRKETYETIQINGKLYNLVPVEAS